MTAHISPFETLMIVLIAGAIIGVAVLLWMYKNTKEKKYFLCKNCGDWKLKEDYKICPYCEKYRK